MEASDSLPEFWEWIFSFPSRSRISGMDSFHSLPVPEFREWGFSIWHLKPPTIRMKTSHNL